MYSIHTSCSSVVVVSAGLSSSFLLVELHVRVQLYAGRRLSTSYFTPLPSPVPAPISRLCQSQLQSSISCSDGHLGRTLVWFRSLTFDLRHLEGSTQNGHSAHTSFVSTLCPVMELWNGVIYTAGFVNTKSCSYNSCTFAFAISYISRFGTSNIVTHHIVCWCRCMILCV